MSVLEWFPDNGVNTITIALPSGSPDAGCVLPRWGVSKAGSKMLPHRVSFHGTEDLVIEILSHST